MSVVHATGRAIRYLLGDPLSYPGPPYAACSGAVIGHEPMFASVDARHLEQGKAPLFPVTCEQCLVLMDAALEKGRAT